MEVTPFSEVSLTRPLPFGEYNTIAAVTADVNGDGATDVILGNTFVKNALAEWNNFHPVQVLRSDGAGNFALENLSTTLGPVTLPRYGYPARPGVCNLAVGDVTGDGHPDILTLSAYGEDNPSSYGPRISMYGCDKVELLTNDGQGSFTPTLLPQMPYLPGGFAGNGGGDVFELGDFNNDGKLDLITDFDHDDSRSPFDDYRHAQIHLGNGDGTFASPYELPGRAQWANNMAFMCQSHLGSATVMNALAMGDFNSDANLDFLLASNCGVLTFLGDGTGGFSVANTIPGQFYVLNFGYTWNDPWIVETMAVADLDGDGHLDAAIVVSGHVRYPLSPRADQSALHLAFGDGNGAFTLSTVPRSALLAESMSAVAIADVTGDGRLDLVLGTQASNDRGGARLLVGHGGRDFSGGVRTLPGGNLVTGAIAIGDFDRQSAGLDIFFATGDKVSGSSVYSRNCTQGGDCTLAPENNRVLLRGILPAFTAVDLEAPGQYMATNKIALGDLNGDGFLDIVAFSSFNQFGNYQSTETMGDVHQLYLNDRGGGFAPSVLPMDVLEEARHLELAECAPPPRPSRRDRSTIFPDADPLHSPPRRSNRAHEQSR